MYGVRCTGVPNFEIYSLLKLCVMNAEEMKRRTKAFAINVAKLHPQIAAHLYQ
jgi:hypothetical protein